MNKLLLRLGLIFFFVGGLKGNISAQISFIDYATRVAHCNYIFEGKVVQSTPYYKNDITYIYTSNTVQISKIFKGNISCGTVEIITDGGEVSGNIQFSAHRLRLAQGVIGVFACNITGKELSSIDYYLESNPQKLEPTFEEQSFIQYVDYNGVIKAYDMFAVYDSLNQLYNLTELITGINFIACNNMIISSGSSVAEKKIISNKGSFSFPKYRKSEYDSIIAQMQTKRALHSAKKYSANNVMSTKTITYSMSNAEITGNGSPYYFEFDVNLQDDVGDVFFNNGLVRLAYDAATFGSNLVANNKIQVTRGTLIQNTSVYMNPTPGDISAQEVAIPLASTATLHRSLHLLHKEFMLKSKSLIA